jgi:hypothetical protein
MPSGDINIKFGQKPYRLQASPGHYQHAPMPTTLNAHGGVVTGGAFDYYISTNGLNGNAGTLASPWAITAINSKGATYAGKRVGIIGNTSASPTVYDVSSLMTTDAQNGSRVPALNINGGPNSSTLTYIGSCDASGNYSPRTVNLKANGNGVFGGQTSSTNAVIGCMNSATNRGNWVVDGLVVTGYSLWGVHIGNSPGAGVTISNWLFKNCEFTGGSCATASNASGVNVGPVIIYSSTNPLADPNFGFNNCYFHDNVAGGTSDSAHFSCVYQWGIGSGGVSTSGTTFTNCTLINTGGLHGKESNIQGTTVRNCYIDWTAGPTGQNGSCIQGFDGATQAGLTQASNFNNNVLVAHDQCIDIEAELSNGGWTTPVNVYNNTFITGTASGQTQYFRYFEQTAGANLLSFYNNLFFDNGHAPATNYGYMITNVGAFALLNYNCYGGGSGSQWNTVAAGAHTSAGVTNRTFAGWKGVVNGGADANSVNSVATLTNAGARALQYTVTTGAAFGTGKVGGISAGASRNIGAWDGIVTQIGSNF